MSKMKENITDKRSVFCINPEHSINKSFKQKLSDGGSAS